MSDLKFFPRASNLPHGLVHQLDVLSSQCMLIDDAVDRTNCILALTDFYQLIGEQKRAKILIESIANEFSGKHACSMPRKDYQRQWIWPIVHTSWNVRQYRISIAKARALLQKGSPDRVVDELLGHRQLFETARNEDVTDFIDIMWSALAEKVQPQSSGQRVPEHRLLRGKLGLRLRSIVPKTLQNAWDYHPKAWYAFSISDIDSCQSMVNEVIVPSLKASEKLIVEWPGLWIKSLGVQALVESRQGNEETVFEALSKSREVAIESQNPLNRKFQLLVRMEAMAMLSHPQEMRAAESEFLGHDQELQSEASVAPFDGKKNDGAVHIGALAFIRSMVAIAWSSFRHPFSDTLIDVESGVTINHKA